VLPCQLAESSAALLQMGRINISAAAQLFKFQLNFFTKKVKNSPKSIVSLTFFLLKVLAQTFGLKNELHYDKVIL
jgi:hypothetical protein